MNQILVTEKLYITPELKRKRKIYKINFMISVIVIVILCSFYIHSEYAKNQEQEVSQTILAELIDQEDGINEVEQEIANEQDEGVWKIMASSIENRNSSNQKAANQNPITAKSKSNQNAAKAVTYITAKGKRYPSIGRIQIPKIDVDQAILDQAEGETLVAWLKISPTKFWGPDLNEPGNVSIAGHNYRNKRFFSKVPNLEVGDKIKITDVTGRTIAYKVFTKYTVNPKNTDCINPIEGKENKRVVTLITCTNDAKKRVIVQAEET